MSIRRMSIQLGDERGQAVPLVLALVAVAVVLVMAFGVFAGDVVDAGRARTAADAAALAGVEGGRAASVRLAAAHDGTVTAWRRQGRVVTVTVRVGAASASARAVGGPIEVGGAARPMDARPPFGRTRCVCWAVVSPSKRAGDTVEPDVDPEVDRSTTVAADGPGSNGGGAGPGGRPAGSSPAPGGRPSKAARPKRRSTTATVAVTPPPERGSASQRGASSSSITRRSVTGTATAGRDHEPQRATQAGAPAPLPAPAASVVEEPTATIAPDPRVEPAVVVSPVVDSPIALPPTMPTPPTARVDPAGRRAAEAAVVASTLPVITPVGAPAQRGTHASSPALIDDPIAPPEPPYVTTTMSSHHVAPVPRIVGRRPRVRKVTRVVRHVDPWSVFKVALIFNLVLFGILLTAGVLLWNVAYATGTIDNLERFFESFGWSEFEFDGGAIFHSGWVAGLFGVVGLTGAAVLGATLFNLITDLVGGIRMTVLEEEVVERTSSPMRRFTVRRPSGAGYDPGSEMQTEGANLPARREPVDDPFL